MGMHFYKIGSQGIQDVAGCLKDSAATGDVARIMVSYRAIEFVFFELDTPLTVVTVDEFDQ